MSHFAKVEGGIVSEVIVAEQDFIDTLEGTWIQTSYNTKHGQHPTKEQFRRNFAGKGYIWDEARDAFYAPQRYPSWTLNESTCRWDAPVIRPDDGKQYTWDEATTNWKEIT